MNRDMKATMINSVFLGLLIVSFVILMVTRNLREGFEEQILKADRPIEQVPGLPQVIVPLRGKSEVPSFDDEAYLRSRIENRPPPPGVDMTDAVVYSPVDLAADIKKIKDQIRNIELNGKSAVSEAVYHQSVPIVGGILREAGFPLTDGTYGDSNCGYANEVN
jgi:hypothetical protein